MLRAATEPAMPGDRSSRNRNESGRPNYGRDADKDKNRARFYTLPYRFSSSRCFRFPRMKSLPTETSSVAAQSDAQPVDASRSQWAAANAFVAIGPCVSRAFLFLHGPTDDRNSGCEHAGYMGAYNCLFIFFPAEPSRALSPAPRPKNFADRTGKARTHEYASEPESSLLSSPFRPGENGKQNRRQGKTQLLTTVSRAASPEAASPFFGVT